MKNENSSTTKLHGQHRETTPLDIGNVTQYVPASEAVSTGHRKSKSRTISISSVHNLDNLKPTTYTETFTHMLKGNIGCGMLSMGMAYKNGGMLFSTILILVIGAISCYNQYILILMANDFKKQFNYERISFSGTVAIAFQNGPKFFQKSANITRWIIEMFIVFTQLGFCCVYFMFVSESLNQIFSCYDINISSQIFMVMVLPIFWITSLIRQLKYIAPLSTLANISIFASLALILYRSVSDLPAISDRDLIGRWDTIPLCFGTVVYGLEGISLVLPLQQNMEKKERFLGTFGVLNVSLSVVVSLMISVGFFGYYKFGNGVQDTLTRNLDAKTDIITQIVIIGMVFGILCTYALQFFIPVLLIMPAVKKWTSSWPGGHTNTYEYILRTVLVLVTFLVAELIPHLDLFVSLIGAVGSSFLALVFSPVADLVRRLKGDYGFCGWRIAVSVISLLIGILGFFTGTTTSLRAIINAIKEDLSIKD